MRVDAPLGDARFRPPWLALAALAVALLSLGAGLFLAWNHPLWPVTTAAAFTIWTAMAARFGRLWLFVLLAALPLLNLSPWTGWLAFEEFDLLLLGVFAGGYARLAIQWAHGPTRLLNEAPRDLSWFVRPAWALALGGLAMLGLFRGVADAAGWTFDWFDGYLQASNSVRASKSLIFVLGLWPLLREEFRTSRTRALGHLARGMQAGLALVGLAVLWERTAYPGLLDFSIPYRTTATFWEMHIGGAAIDAYLAIATPFSAWALVSARSRLGWAVAAALALLTGHAVLTTFSRGAYVGVVVPLVVLGAAWWMRRVDDTGRVAALAAAQWACFVFGSAAVLTLSFVAFGYGGGLIAILALSVLLFATRWRARSSQWRQTAAMALTLALLAEIIMVISGGAFLRSRLDSSERDFGARLTHWRNGLELLKIPADWALGIGAGRLPAHYARQVPRGEFSGDLTLVSNAPGGNAIRLSGPAKVDELAGLFAVTQRIDLRPGTYRVRLLARAEKATMLIVDVCEQHLLYARDCQEAIVPVAPKADDWQWISTPLKGPELDTGHWYAPRLGVFSISVLTAGTAVDLAMINVGVSDATEILRNGDFSAQLAHWFPVAQSHFLPWHIDNLYLELLIERGFLSLVALAALLALGFRSLLSASKQDQPVANVLAASVFGALLVGCVSSVMDVPRVALLLFLLIACLIETGASHCRGTN